MNDFHHNPLDGPDAQRLRHAHPGSEPDVPLDVLLAVASDVVQHERGRTQRRRRTVGVVASLAAAAILIPSGVAAAGGWQALTGELHIFDDSDRPNKVAEPAIDICASDFPDYAASLPVPTTIVPPGHDWSTLARTAATRMQRVASEDCSGPGAQMGETGVRAQSMMHGLYHWQCLTIRRAESGDAIGAREAGEATASLYEELHDLGIWGGDFWIELRDAARNLDLAVLKQDVAVNSPVPCP